LSPEDVLKELSRREGLGGLEEKALRKAQAREAGED
jgi:phosphoribosyl-ATP pyrophosphohydrolase